MCSVRAFLLKWLSPFLDSFQSTMIHKRNKSCFLYLVNLLQPLIYILSQLHLSCRLEQQGLTQIADLKKILFLLLNKARAERWGTDRRNYTGLKSSQVFPNRVLHSTFFFFSNVSLFCLCQETIGWNWWKWISCAVRLLGIVSYFYFILSDLFIIFLLQLFYYCWTG